MSRDQELRQHLVHLLDWSEAHVALDRATEDFPPELRGVRPAGLDHSAWEILEHIRIAQWDILEFSRKPNTSRPTTPRATGPLTAPHHPTPPGTSR